MNGQLKLYCFGLVSGFNLSAGCVGVFNEPNSATEVPGIVEHVDSDSKSQENNVTNSGKGVGVPGVDGPMSGGEDTSGVRSTDPVSDPGVSSTEDGGAGLLAEPEMKDDDGKEETGGESGVDGGFSSWRRGSGDGCLGSCSEGSVS